MKKGEESPTTLLSVRLNYYGKWMFCYWNQRNSQTNRPSSKKKNMIEMYLEYRSYHGI